MEPPPSKPKSRSRDESRCCRCSSTIRHAGPGCKKIKSDEEADHFLKIYDYFVEPDQSLCDRCFLTLRREKSRNQRSLSDNVSQPEQSTPDPSLSVPRPTGKETLPNSQSSQYISESTSSQSTSQESQYSLYTPEENQEIELINMPFDRVVASHGYCFLCKNKEGLIDVPLQARIQVFVERRLFIPKRNRCCSSHLIKQQFYKDEISKMIIYSNESLIDIDEVKIFFEKLSDNVQSDLHGQIGSHLISDERIKALTGYSWDSIDKITKKLETMRESHNRNVTQALVMFLIKLRSGSSDAFIAAILDVSENIVNQSINSILECFRTHVLPNHFGIQNYSREFLLTQKAVVADLLFGDYEDDCLFIICDGTYLRHEKSSNNAYQRKAYSGQKKTPLCKPFTICTSNGFVIDLEGPFEANLNDAEILRLLLGDPNGLITILKKGDVFILDRGFRDVVPFLEEKGFKVLMPALKGKRKQLTCKESNESRLVTKLRWVVEAVHGIISQKNDLLHKLHNSLLPNAGTYCKAACFIYNLTSQRLNSDAQNLEEIVGRMKNRKEVENDLAIMVAEKNFGRKTKPFECGSAEDFDDFPQLTEKELKLLFTGTYQLKQAVSYLGELLDVDNQLQINYLIEEKGILKTEVRSRHINSKTYKCFIHYTPDDTGIDAIKGYCCDCANGLRTVGCCSHVAAIIYYLAHGRFLSKIIRPAEKLTYLFQIDNIIPVINEDSDED